MSEEILVNVTPSETRVALVENGMLQEVHIERASRCGILGNIYRGRVSRVLPGMQAAFVDIGSERAAFLHATDIHFEAADDGDELVREANGDALPITALVHEGTDLLVQVVKEPIGSKGARLTTNLSLPSRYLVLMPRSPMIGVSVRIEDDAERDRLKGLVAQAQSEANDHGYIVRTNAEGIAGDAIAADLEYLDRLYRSVADKAAQARSPGTPIYEDLPLAVRTLRDLTRREVERIRVDDAASLARMREFAATFMPSWHRRIEAYRGERPIFDSYGVEDEIERALSRHVPLKSGGHLVIDQTEAMTTIDVNTGGFVGHRNLEETIFKTNLEAAQSIARQLRLRNLGGIIIIDFIDMVEVNHREALLKTLAKALDRDPARTSISGISALGLVEMTRKRTTESLGHLLCEPCPHCDGSGAIKTTETVCYEIFREITRAVHQFDAERLLVLAAPKVVYRILEDESQVVAQLESAIGKTIAFQAEDQYDQEHFDVVLV